MNAKAWMLEKLNGMLSEEAIEEAPDEVCVPLRALERARSVISELPDGIAYPASIDPARNGVYVRFVVWDTHCTLHISEYSVYIQASQSTESDTLPAWVLAALKGRGTYDAR